MFLTSTVHFEDSEIVGLAYCIEHYLVVARERVRDVVGKAAELNRIAYLERYDDEKARVVEVLQPVEWATAPQRFWGDMAFVGDDDDAVTLHRWLGNLLYNLDEVKNEAVIWQLKEWRDDPRAKKPGSAHVPGTKKFVPEHVRAYWLNAPELVTAEEEASIMAKVELEKKAQYVGDRAVAISRIRDALRVRSGKPWSVTGGKAGTGWSSILICSPPKRLVGHKENPEWIALGRPLTHAGSSIRQWVDDPFAEHRGYMPESDIMELTKLLGLRDSVHFQGERVLDGSTGYSEYVARAEGKLPRWHVSRRSWDRA